MKVTVRVTVKDGDRQCTASVTIDEAGTYRGTRDPLVGVVNAGLDGARKVVAETIAPRGRTVSR